jgi:hypothetical protein
METGKKVKIEVAADTYAALQRMARPFEDTPDSVIRRLLDREAQASNGHSVRRNPERAPVGSILPEHEYELPILQSLARRGVRAVGD